MTEQHRIEWPPVELDAEATAAYKNSTLSARRLAFHSPIAAGIDTGTTARVQFRDNKGGTLDVLHIEGTKAV